MSKNSGPVQRLVIYRPKQGHYDQLEAILRQHGPILVKSGLTHGDVKVWRATDLRRHGAPEPYFVELFYWRDEAASDLAHQMPEIMSVWETMGPHLQDMTLTTLESLA